ncbi:hypothetical protein ACOMHN_063482 [Nucella lapillus]
MRVTSCVTQAYDDEQAGEARRKGDEVGERKFTVESDVARKHLADLVTRVTKTKAKCLAVHLNYETPEEGARLVFEDLKRHVESVLLKEGVTLSPRGLELSFHDAYLANRTSLYVGGQGHMKELDSTLTRGGGHLVVGPAGSGKGALVSNWLTALRKKKSHELVYHFVGCSKNSTSVWLCSLCVTMLQVWNLCSRCVSMMKVCVYDEGVESMLQMCVYAPGVSELLQRLTEELLLVAGERRPRKLTLEDSEDREMKSNDLSDLFQQLEVALGKGSKKRKVVIVIDGVGRVEPLSRISKTLFWLPVDLPPKTVTMVVTCRDNNTDVIAELTSRGYSMTHMKPLTEQQKKEFCVGFLQQHSKELSAPQLKTILDTQQAANPFFLKIVTAELCSFGNFRKLDSKIASLVKAKSVAELFEKFLVRLEEDHNTGEGTEKNLIQQVMSGLALVKKGLTETEIMKMLKIPSAAWSPLYFAIKDFIMDHSGLLT